MALPFALLALGGGFVWAATRKPTPSTSNGGTPLALPPAPLPGLASPVVVPSPAPAPPVLDQAQQILTQYALDPGMPANLAAQVARVLSAEGDPAKLDDWASKLDQLNFPKAAQALRAKASALRAVAGAGAALGQIHDVLQGPGSALPIQPPAPPPAPAPVVAPPSAPISPSPVSPAPTPPISPISVGPGAPPSQPPFGAPAGTDPRAVAQAAADDIRLKGCWHESRDLVKQFQRLVYPAAGEVDGFYGPQVAIAMAKYVPKVPAPCYWPKAPSDRARAKAAWERMVRQANINVGRLAAGG